MFETLEGWQDSTQGARSWAQLPATCIKYVRRIEELIELLGRRMKAGGRFVTRCFTETGQRYSTEEVFHRLHQRGAGDDAAGESPSMNASL